MSACEIAAVLGNYLSALPRGCDPRPALMRAPRGAGAGIALAVTAYACFSVHDATVKWLVALLPVWQVLFVRSTVIVLGSLAIGRGRLLGRVVATPLKKPLLLRGALTLCAWLCYYTAARGLGLAELTTLYFSAPLIVDRCSPRRCSASG